MILAFFLTFEKKTKKKKTLSKQNSPRLDAAFCGVASGAMLFAYVPQIDRQAYKEIMSYKISSL